MQTITPCLWFDGQAEAAAELYVSLFPNSRIDKVTRWPEGSPGPAGEVLTVEFTLGGRPFLALNGGPEFHFTEAISFQIPCKDQAEVDRYWNGLLAGGGRESQCGWLKDRFGLSWQVFPEILPRLIADPDQARAQRVMAAMLKMAKIDVAAIEEAARS